MMMHLKSINYIVSRQCRFGRTINRRFLWQTAPASDSIGSTDFEVKYEPGLLDNQGMTVFNTLHELQEVACKVYANNDLFGTFSEQSQKFEYLTYKEFGHKVEECRAVLKHLGKWLFSSS
jgi:hypothetical protein